jgi:trk system potassium uptake protein TrkH
VIPLRLGSDIVSEKIAHKVAVYGMAWLAMMVGGLLAVTALGAELEEALSAVVGSLGNMGPAFGSSGPTATFQAGFSTPARLVLAFLMIAGRLELIAVLLMFAAPRRSLRKIRPHKHTF